MTLTLLTVRQIQRGSREPELTVPVSGFKCGHTLLAIEHSMATHSGSLGRSAVSWYTDKLNMLLWFGGGVLLLVMFGVGPTNVVVSLGFLLVVQFVVLFLSLLRGSDTVYSLFT